MSALVRAASIDRPRDSLATVQRYLPSRYTACQQEDGSIRIVGRDVAGWTLDGYVIPRLASGMIWAHEVPTTAAEDAAAAYAG